MLTATWGIVEGAQRARSSMPSLGTEGQRLILACLVLFMGADSTSGPTSGQLAEVSGFHASSVRRILGQLKESGAIVAVGTRPVADSNGSGRGGKVTRWSIPPAPLEATVPPAPEGEAEGSHSRPGALPPAPLKARH